MTVAARFDPAAALDRFDNHSHKERVPSVLQRDLRAYRHTIGQPRQA